jgi:hypothetical protein
MDERKLAAASIAVHRTKKWYRHASREGNRLFVGRLRGLTVIELLSQPFFFFRTRENLQVSRANRVSARKDEMNRRDKNGAMRDELTDIVWAPIIAPPSRSPTPPSTGATPPRTTAGTPPPPSAHTTPPPTGATLPPITVPPGGPVVREPELPARPCEELRRRLNELKSNGSIHERLEKFREDHVTVDPNGTRWLNEDEIVHAVAAVASAITNEQDFNHSFSIPSTMNLVDVQMGRESPVPRPCRPIMFPIVIEQLVLALVQMNRNGDLSFSILDSMFTYLSAQQRERVFRQVMRTVRYTEWWRWRYTAWENVRTPSTALWIPCAQQPTEQECGYYAIIFAWALALGLELNPHAAPIWDSSLFEDVLDIAHLARLGLVDWTLIHDFLRYHRFVLDGSVPEHRRFARSQQVLTAQDWDVYSEEFSQLECRAHNGQVGFCVRAEARRRKEGLGCFLSNERKREYIPYR